MPIIGEIIKKAVEVSGKIFSHPDPVEAQETVLKDLLKKAKGTAFGKYYQFEKILNEEDLHQAFAAEVPYFSYDTLREQWWQKVIDGGEDITWPGKVSYFAVSSGTTSTKKHIPVTEDMLISIRKAGMQQIKGIADFDLPAEFFEKEILMFGSSTDLKEVNGHLEGEISGISASQIPFWFDGFYRPGKEISSINDWDERVEALAKEAKNWDIGGISGIPAWIELMMKKVIAYHNASDIHEIWPNFQVYTSGGVAFEPYRKSFEKITSKPITVIDTYLSSEGYLATQIRKDTDSMALITDNGVYFEFVPFLPENMNDDGTVKPDVKSLKIGEVEVGVDYVLIISTVSGAWRYMIGDTVAFTDKDKAEIKITGRTKHFLNVVGSQLSVIQMNKALEQIGEEFDCDIKEFTVSAILEEGEYLHRWYLGLDGNIDRDEKAIANRIDALLQENNKNYKVARGKALKSVEAKLIPVNLFQEWTEETKQKGGQVKFPRVMKEADFRDWEKFVLDKTKGST
ncbi:GH3 auxin-responsive promoter [Rhodonellum psychrophilum GCM71 = DSM 17998]|uniref:GH3 auxin-responsive promoter n=2 Tax=Rhodonellum TaxID=336827 RepID=U5BXY3_9BACT|nr:MULTISPECIES: GH3 auxin-responsive promoter family protein [Rhodonellum]ERM81486.1 GH3 auxin-responsive promoter [Rhodonellum psychrophilum GCM71 = DSM 17998]SDZ29497.1 GH3 auxin-responsive promoter [Rhodonellum ikkaensis]